MIFWLNLSVLPTEQLEHAQRISRLNKTKLMTKRFEKMFFQQTLCHTLLSSSFDNGHFAFPLLHLLSYCLAGCQSCLCSTAFQRFTSRFARFQLQHSVGGPGITENHAWHVTNIHKPIPTTLWLIDSFELQYFRQPVTKLWSFAACHLSDFCWVVEKFRAFPAS